MKNKFSWFSKSLKYSDEYDLILNTIRSILNEIQHDKTYICMPKMFVKYTSSFIQVSKQIFFDKQTDPELLVLKIMAGIHEKIAKNYNIQYGDTIIIEYRALDDKIYLRPRKINVDQYLRTAKGGLKSRYFSEYYYPFSTAEKDFGKLIGIKSLEYGIEKLFQYNDKYRISRQELSPTSFKCVVKLNDGHELFSFYDEVFEDYFVRRINDLRLFFNLAGSLIKTEGDMNVNFIKNKKKEFPFMGKIITMDMETYIKSGEFIPYAIGWYDGVKCHTYYKTGFEDHQEMILKAFEDLMIKKYNGYTVYFHNLQGFDGVLLLQILENTYEVDTMFKEDKRILQMTIKSRKKEIESASLGGRRRPAIFNIKIRDSYLLLPHSLRQLAIEFEVESKGYFPYKFVSEGTLDYIGRTPSYKFYENIDVATYQTELKDNWSTKDETLLYLEKDLIAQYQVLEKFAKNIYSQYQLNITSCLSLPSLASGIFRSSFYEKPVIPILTGKIYKDIRSSYVGGITEVYKPRGENLYTYDVNSLYPYAMKQDMPTGTPVYTTETDLDKLFGFVYTTVESPNGMYIPVLPVKLSNG